MKVRNLITILSAGVVFLFSTECKRTELLYAGRFTKGDEKGLYILSFNSKRGTLKLKFLEEAGPAPSYFCFSKDKSLLYVINEVMEFNGISGGGLTTLRLNYLTGQVIEKPGELLLPYGGPCHVSVSADGRYILVANYPKGSAVVLQLDNNGIPVAITDTILYSRDEPDRSHAHMIQHDPAGKYVYVTDLGLDRVVAYTLDTVKGELIGIENGITGLPRGSGPRHFIFNRDGSVMYVINELGSTITVFNVNKETGVLTSVQTVKTISEDYIENNYCAEILPGKDERYLYGSNRGENTIVVFRVLDDGKLEVAGRVPCGGNWPRNFVINPEGNFLLVGNQKSGNISVFRINHENGLPEGPVEVADIPDVAFLLFRTN